MTAGMTTLLICQRALADAGTRSSITAVGGADTSPESIYCNLFYTGVRDQILRAANWNFAKRSALLQMWKALPGTAENPTLATTSGWINAYPEPPWVYSYIYPSDCLRARALIGQPQQVPIAPPIFSGSQGTNPPISQRLPFARFEIGADYYDQSGQLVSLTYGVTSATVVNGGGGYAPGDYVVLAGGNAGIPCVLLIQTVQGLGGPFLLTTPTGRLLLTQGGALQISGTQSVIVGAVTNATVANPGTYTQAPTNPMVQVATSGQGTGLQVNVTSALNASPQTVVLTNQEFALLTYTFAANNEAMWDAMMEEAMIAALAARLTQPLTGDKALAREKYTIANAIITNARVVDGNEGLTLNDHTPDWIATRGSGGGLGYEMFFYPFGPLFPVAPLV